MDYSRLGRSGLEVSRLGFGTTHFGKYLAEPECWRQLDRVVDLGINFIDTANSYGGPGHRGWSEAILGRWLGLGDGRRDRIILSTKVGFHLADEPNRGPGLSALKIRRELEASLRRLRTDRVDLYTMHHIDRHVGWEELWGVYEALVAEGKVRYAGSSNFPAWAIADAQGRARARGFLGLASEQHQYMLARREPELEVLPCCQALGIGLIVYSPLGGGLLGGGALRPQEGGRAIRENVQSEVTRCRGQIEAFETFSRARGEPPAAVGLAWVMHNPAVTSTLIGPRSHEQLDTSLRAPGLKLDAAALEALDRIFPGPGGPAPQAYAW